MNNHELTRTEWLIGTESLQKLKNSSVAVFGIGGVGSFTVEALTRSGVGRIMLVDYDVVDVTNLNRQLQALQSNIGEPKAQVMEKRMKQIRPDMQIEVRFEKYLPDNAETFFATDWDYVVDAMDMVTAKLDLIERCHKRNIPIISSMGAANKLSPGNLRIADLSRTTMCPLAKIVRKELRKRGVEHLKVVYSDEAPQSRYRPLEAGQTPASISFVPSVAGLMLASQVVNDLISETL